mmetsp:Transcript_24008/g.60054  ORF Transcript_24008/g.60054 Transcript_24008/m.60054 type:complete len:205 (-) Transcript_24008:1834-2448(-)
MPSVRRRSVRTAAVVVVLAMIPAPAPAPARHRSRSRRSPRRPTCWRSGLGLRRDLPQIARRASSLAAAVVHRWKRTAVCGDASPTTMWICTRWWPERAPREWRTTTDSWRCASLATLTTRHRFAPRTWTPRRLPGIWSARGVRSGSMSANGVVPFSAARSSTSSWHSAGIVWAASRSSSILSCRSGSTPIFRCPPEVASHLVTA